MLRAALQIIVPLVLPFLLYGLYAGWVRRRQAEAEAAGGVWDDAPWARLIGAAAILLALSLAAFRLETTGDTKGTYVPPHVVDGKVVPGGKQ